MKKTEESNHDKSQIKAIVDLADAIRKIFAKLTRERRKAAWKAISGDRGQKEIDRLILNPKQSLNRFRSLREWLENDDEM